MYYSFYKETMVLKKKYLQQIRSDMIYRLKVEEWSNEAGIFRIFVFAALFLESGILESLYKCWSKLHLVDCADVSMIRISKREL